MKESWRKWQNGVCGRHGGKERAVDFTRCVRTESFRLKRVVYLGKVMRTMEWRFRYDMLV